MISQIMWYLYSHVRCLLRSEWMKRLIKIEDEYGQVKNMPKEVGGRGQAPNVHSGDVIKPYGDQHPWQGTNILRPVTALYKRPKTRYKV
jgi:hypothetical protein